MRTCVLCTIAEQLRTPEFNNLKVHHPTVSLSVKLAPDLMNIRGSGPHLGKCLMNLVANAAEAMPEGGQLTIATANTYLDQAHKGYEHIEEGEYVTLTVQDTGVGIAEVDREHIFEPFYTKKEMGRSGSGLGMAVVWGTVKDHNGM